MIDFDKYMIAATAAADAAAEAKRLLLWARRQTNAAAREGFDQPDHAGDVKLGEAAYAAAVAAEKSADVAGAIIHHITTRQEG